MWKTSILLVLLFGAIGLNAYSYDSYNLENYCGLTVTLPCSKDGYGRAGTMKYESHIVPDTSCVVNITVSTDGDCPSYRWYYIYFNVRKLDIYTGASVTIRESSKYTPDLWSLRKTMSGYGSGNYNTPKSVAQFKSEEMTNTPRISLTFETASSFSLTTSYLTLDYNVVHDVAGDGDSYCSGLSGYISDDVICESEDRVTCPTSYWSSSTDSNPARYVDQSSHSVCQLGVGAIVGIVFGAIIAIVIVAALIVLGSRRRRVVRHVPGVTVPVNNQYQYSNQMVVTTQGHPQGYPPQQQMYGNYAGPPPQYAGPYPGHPASFPAVYPTPGPAGAQVMPPPQAPAPAPENASN